MYKKMQRGRLCNLHKTAFFELHFLCSKSSKLRAIKFRPCENDIFFGTRWVYFIFWSLHIFYLKKTKYITRCSVKSSIIYTGPIFCSCTFRFQNRQKFWVTRFRCCEKVFVQYKTNEFFPSLPPEIFYLKKRKYTKSCSVESSTIYAGDEKMR